MSTTFFAARRSRGFKRIESAPIFFIHPSLYSWSFWTLIELPFLRFNRLFQTRAERDEKQVLNSIVASHFSSTPDGKPVWKFENLSLQLPGKFDSEQRTVMNDLREVYYEQHYSSYFAFGHLVHDGDTVLDCGANIGAFSVWAAHKGRNVRVIAFEPQRDIFSCLQENARINGLSEQITCKQIGLSNESCSMTFIQNNACFTMGKFTLDDSTTAAPDALHCRSIDDLAAEENWSRCDVIKMDIEGFERHALRGAAKTIARFQPRLAIAAYHLPSDPYVLAMIVREINPNYNIIVSSHFILYAFI